MSDDEPEPTSPCLEACLFDPYSYCEEEGPEPPQDDTVIMMPAELVKLGEKLAIEMADAPTTTPSSSPEAATSTEPPSFEEETDVQVGTWLNL